MFKNLQVDVLGKYSVEELWLKSHFSGQSGYAKVSDRVIFVPWYWWTKVIIFYSYLHVLQLKYKVTKSKETAHFASECIIVQPKCSFYVTVKLGRLYPWVLHLKSDTILISHLSLFLKKDELNALHQKNMTENIIEIITFKKTSTVISQDYSNYQKDM